MVVHHILAAQGVSSNGLSTRLRARAAGIIGAEVFLETQTCRWQGKGRIVDGNLFNRNELLAQKVIKGLESRKIALELIGEGASVGMGGCMSALEIGLVDALKEGPYTFIDRSTYADQRAALLDTYAADAFLTSANAMTYDGVIVNIDGNANRVSCIAQGPRKVVFIVGMNKLCCDLDSAMKRARNVAAPANVQRFDIDTPCKKTGSCFDCKSPDTVCCQFLITRFSRHAGRINVVLVNEALGF